MDCEVRFHDVASMIFYVFPLSDYAGLVIYEKGWAAK